MSTQISTFQIQHISTHRGSIITHTSPLTHLKKLSPQRWNAKINPTTISSTESNHDDNMTVPSNRGANLSETRNAVRQTFVSNEKPKNHVDRYTTIRNKSMKKGLDPIISLNMNLDSLAKSGQRGAARRAEAMLLRVEKLYEDGYYEEKPDVVSYNTVLNCWSKSGEKKCAQYAEKLLQRMEELYEDGNDELKPNVISFNSVIAAFARSSEKDSPKRAEEMLHQMEELAEAGNRDVLPNTITYNTVLDAYARKSHRDVDAAKRSETILRKMIQQYQQDGKNERLKPNLNSFNTVLKAWANSRARNACEKTEELFGEFFSSGKYEDVKPSSFSYGSLVAAFSKNNKSSAAQQAERVLEEMMELYYAGDETLAPNKFIFSSIIHAYSKEGKAEEAETVLRRMEYLSADGVENVKPDCVCYTSVLNAYARSSRRFPTAPFHAEAILNRMQALYEETGDVDIKPNVRSFCTVINAFAQSGQDGADRIFLEMERLHYENNDNSLKPNTFIYNSIINAVAKGTSSRKGIRALSYLSKMEEDYKNGNKEARPDLITCNSVINACAMDYGTAEEREEAMTIAIRVFKKVHRSTKIRQTSATYAVLIKACRKLMKKVCMDGVAKCFQMCCSDGKVNDEVLYQLRLSCPSDFVDNLLGNRGDSTLLRIKDLPTTWSCNAM